MGDGDWRKRYQQMQDELALAKYESQKWKEKYLVEKQRRRRIAKDLLDLMVIADKHKHFDDNHAGRTSSVFSDAIDHVGNMLSPTLSSFDFDDSGEDDGDEGEGDMAQDSPVLVPHASSRSSIDGDGENEFDMDLFKDQFHQRQSVLSTNGNSWPPARNRSSTTGSLDTLRMSLKNDHQLEEDGHQPSQSLLYRILYSKSSSRDLWHARANPTKFHSVAQSIMFSLHLKKEHVFENFFVAGISIGTTEREYAAKSSTGFAGYWKPRLLATYPHRVNGLADGSVVDFCFPQGVPLAMCTESQAEALNGAVVSSWSTDADRIQKRLLEPFRSSGYTFRLTGAKGEVLYGFCIAVMAEVRERAEGQSAITAPGAPQSSRPLSPRSDWTKRASCPSGSFEELKNKKDSKRAKEGMNKEKHKALAPVCYCFTSKFPFYRLHFSVLRMIVENEINARLLEKTSASTIEYEITVRPKSELGLEFTICHEENLRTRKSSLSDAGNLGLSTIASELHTTVDSHVILREDASIKAVSNNVSHGKEKQPPQRFQKSHSTDEIGSYNFSSDFVVVDKPMIKHVLENCPDDYRSRVKPGDVLDAVDGIATESLSFEEAIHLLNSGDRLMKLRFRRPCSRDNGINSSIRKQNNGYLSSSSMDILHRVRGLKIGDPGHWSTARLPTFDLNYQFPKGHSERWSCGVVLRFLTPESIVVALGHLLLEKQVVVMGECPAKVSAVCTALMLLLAPFQWQSTYIPLLPSGLLDFLHSPVPFLVGCHPLEDTEEWPEVCFYNIDKNEIKVPATSYHVDQTSLPNGVQLCELLQAAKERFNALRPTSKPWHELSDEEDKIITLTMQEAEIFLRDMCCDISSLDLTLTKGKSFYDVLQEEVAKEVRKSMFEAYLEEFSQTQLFCQYCESILRPGEQPAG